MTVFSGGKKHYQQLHLTHGFQSSSPPEIHFGLGTAKIDSLLMTWPNGKVYRLSEDVSNQTLHLSCDLGFNANFSEDFETQKKFEKDTINGLIFTYKEKYYPEFDREKLMPYGLTNEGTVIAVGDINQDGKKDLFIGGSKGESAVLYTATSEGFIKTNKEIFEIDKQSEDVDAIFIDIDSDNDLDLIVISGGGEYTGQVAQRLDRVYLNDGNGIFNKSSTTLPVYYHNGSIIKNCDIDQDGDFDLFIGSRSVPNAFGQSPDGYLLKNDRGKLSFFQEDKFKALGMVTDAVFLDFDYDGDEDLFIVAEWSKLRLFENNNGTFVEKTEEIIINNPSGLWQKVLPFDVDGDGDTDLVAGNVGLNTKFIGSEKFPMKMYVDDFDKNGQVESLIAIAKNGNYYPIDNKDKLMEQLETIVKKKFNSYTDFAGKNIQQVLGKSQLERADLKYVENLQSGYFEYENGKYNFVSFPSEFQWGPIRLIKKIDFLKSTALVLGGVKKDLPPFQGNWASQPYILFNSINDYEVLSKKGIPLLHEKIGTLEQIEWNSNSYLIVLPENKPLNAYRIIEN